MSFKTEGTRFQIEGASWTMEFSKLAVSVMQTHAQNQANLCESVGQLYARDLTSNRIFIEHATRLKPHRATRARVQFNPKAAYAERVALFREGLHCVGIWHTHPEPYPSPSSEDKVLARDYALAAKPELTGIVFVIVGTLPAPDSYKVWVDNGEELSLAFIVR